MSDELRDLAAALRAVSGVSSATVESDAAGDADALRLGLEPGADGAEVARAAGRLLAEHLGTSTVAPVVTIDVQAHEPESTGTHDLPPAQQAPRVPAQRRSRLCVGRTDVVTDGLLSSATVALSSAEDSATGRAKGVATRAGLHRAVAQATLLALERLLDQPVSLTLVTSEGAEQLTGSAIVRQDRVGAVVRATLDALNRR